MELKQFKIVAFLVSLCALLPSNICQLIGGDMPVELVECIQLLGINNTGDPISIYDTTEDIHAQCLQQFLWKNDRVEWNKFNITEKDKGFINSLVRSFVRRGRTKRQAGPGGIFPQTGFRIRREYRRISDGERFALHMAFNQMKTSGQYDTFANMHQGIVITSAHDGPNFLGWHRVYLALVEEALRSITPWISLPYWDSTLDFDMANPVDSIIWSETFLGNGDGFVTTGPFADWMAAGGQLTRNIGGGSTLFSKEVIRTIMTRCRTADITVPTALPQFNLERHHGGPHIWVGGQMSGLNTAAHDPVFFLHHAFVDYIWELFRIRQAIFCGVNPSTDYPPTAGQHMADRPMDRFPQYLNIDGYRGYWTQLWYRYERSPTCSMWRPFCGSPYLRCDLARQRCVSMARMGPTPIGGGGSLAGGRMGFAAGAAGSMASASRARIQEATIITGPKFRAPPPEPRTQDAQMVMAPRRMKRALKQNIQSKRIQLETNILSTPTVIASLLQAQQVDAQISGKHAVTCSVKQPSCESPYMRCDLRVQRCVPIDSIGMRQSSTQKSMESKPVKKGKSMYPAHPQFGPVFQAPPSDGHTSGISNETLRRGALGVDHRGLTDSSLQKGSTFPISDSMELLPRPDYHAPPDDNKLRPPIENTFVLNGHAGIDQWAFIPVRVIYTNVRSQRLSSYKSQNRQNVTADRCVQDESGAMQVRIQSIGLNYDGEFSDYALIDRHLPVDSATAYIGIKSPELQDTRLILSAVHSCGLMCQAYCFLPGTTPPTFRPCTGALKLTSNDLHVYGRTYEEAVSLTWQGTISGGDIRTENIRVFFDCSDVDMPPVSYT